MDPEVLLGYLRIYGTRGERAAWSSVCEYQSGECAFTSPVSIESGKLVTCRMQYAMSVSTVL